MTQALTASFSSWEKERESLNIVKDPRQWSEMDVANWLSWAIPRVQPGRRQHAHLCHEGQGHVCTRQGCLPRKVSALHGRHPLGAPGHS
ncbi:hypothetical protein MRX96_027721 [Rhipicephalus microplus]